MLRAKLMSLGVAVLGVAAVLAGANILVSTGSDPNTPVAPEALELSTVKVEQRDLVIDHVMVATLEPASSREVTAPGAGLVVELAEVGTPVVSGSVIAVVDDRPVAVLPGDLPAWRDLDIGDVGPDVAQLESALVGAGFDPAGSVTVDDEYTAASASMVEVWQESIGAEPTGAVGRRDVVYVTEEMRIETVHAATGATVVAGEPLVELASVERIADAEVPLDEVGGLALGASVTVRLPDGSTLGGAVQTLVTGEEGTTVSIIVGFDTAGIVDGELAGLGSVELDLSWSEPVAVDVLTLPAGAFRRLDDGTYVVEIVDIGPDGERAELQSVTVEPGRQVGSRVEVSGVPRDVDIVVP
jgi:hypothetical protein